MAEHRGDIANGTRAPLRAPSALAKAPASEAGVDDVARARELAERYHLDFVDLANYRINHELFRSIQVDLMFRYKFVPLEEMPGNRLAIAVSDPSKVMMTIDEIALLLGKRIVTRVATQKQIDDLLTKTEQ